VLLVEDEPGYARFLREVLLEAEDDGYEAECVHSLDAALERLRAGELDIVLLDLGLPDADGTEALERVGERAPDLPVVVLSARNELDVALASMRIGAQEYLVKGQAEHLLLPRAIRYAIERKRLQSGVVAARAEAERANAVKDDFLAMLGHELRNPLAPIVSALDLLERKEHSDIDRELTILRRQVNHLVYLVSDLLDVARIAHGKVELHRSVVDVADVVSTAVETAGPLLEERGHHLSLAVPHGRWLVNGDAARLAQVVSNLLTNAAKYTEQGGHVAVRARGDGDAVELSVEDDGVGMDPALLARVFEVFVQGERQLHRSSGGLGIGLSIARRLVTLHGGTLSATSDGNGKGSCFVIRLPLHLAAASARASDAQAAPAAASNGARRVLIVDDNADGAEMLELALRSLGHATCVAHDGPNALAAVRTFRPDVALLDIGLPVMDGFEVARRMQAEFGARAPVLIAVTGYGQGTDRDRSRAAGFAQHLVKPVELDALAAALAASPGPRGPGETGAG
jgi:signal transduction histidine kinase